MQQLTSFRSYHKQRPPQSRSSSNARGCCSSSTGGPGSWKSQDSSSDPHRSQPAASQHRELSPLPQQGADTGSQASPTPPGEGSPCPLWPCCHWGRAGWVNPTPPPDLCPGWENLSPRMMPEADHFAGSFIQTQLTGKGEAGSQAYDQVSDWKRWVCSRAVKYFSASEGDRPPSSCNTDCKASATAAGICLAFLEERAGDVMEGKQENLGHIHIPCAPVRQQVPAAGPTGPQHKPGHMG